LEPHREQRGAGTFILNFDMVTPPTLTPPAAVSTMGAAATPAPLRLFVFSFPLLKAPPVVAVGLGGAGGLYVGRAVYPLIEPAPSPIIDACPVSVEQVRAYSQYAKKAGKLLEAELAVCEKPAGTSSGNG